MNEDRPSQKQKSRLRGAGTNPVKGLLSLHPACKGQGKPMEYRGVEYEIVQTITNAWRWSVKREDGSKMGIVLDRDTAMQRAERLIDELIKASSKPKK